MLRSAHVVGIPRPARHLRALFALVLGLMTMKADANATVEPNQAGRVRIQLQ